MNPLDGMGTREIFDRALSDTSAITDIEHDEEEAILVLGEASELPGPIQPLERLI